MKILHLTTSLENAGAQAILYNVITRSGEHSHEVINLMDDDHYGIKIREGELTLHSLGNSPSRLSLKSMIQIYRIIKRSNADCIQTWMYHADLVGSIIAFIAGERNIVWSVHNSILKPESGITTNIVFQSLRVLSRFVPKTIIFCSKNAMEYHIEQGYPDQKSIFVPNGYDSRNYRALTRQDALANLETRITIPEGTLNNLKANSEKTVIRIAMIARWAPQKDHQNLFRAIKFIDSANTLTADVFLAGSGMDLDNRELLSTIDTLQIRERVSIFGVCENVAALLSLMDILVLPSAFGEAFPNVVAEAMLCGVPCVVTDIGDASWMVGNTGLTVPPGDPIALAKAILRMASAKKDAKYWKELKQQCRKRAVDCFSIDDMTSRYNEVWADTLASGAGPTH